MKRTVFLALSAALMVSPVFAEDLCAIQLQKIENALNTTPAASSGSNVQIERIREFQKEAQQHQKAGDIEKCIASANQALTLARQPGGDTDTGGAK
ncbi:hypothetical protein IQ22_03597 [Pseudomonas duriflava]|uniref:Secreted protein n=1 Tax=Pseudomonas duriflava TaxID=459528 RepID=A0A562Q6S3_9PSED|nr:hypothetical protein [Pseudomonas duriflava]TWI52452.1 hypothetical protein IQ22_03597 [Pseudomonas duriflava]